MFKISSYLLFIAVSPFIPCPSKDNDNDEDNKNNDNMLLVFCQKGILSQHKVMVYVNYCPQASASEGQCYLLFLSYSAKER